MILSLEGWPTKERLRHMYFPYEVFKNINFVENLEKAASAKKNKNTETMWIIRIKNLKKICLCMQTLVRINLFNEKQKN